MRRFLTWKGEHNTPVTIYSWVGAATRYLLLKRGVVGNTKISRIEDERVAAAKRWLKWSPPNVITRW